MPLLGAMVVPGSPASGCYSYEPNVVAPQGMMFRETFAGPPNYENVEKVDELKLFEGEPEGFGGKIPNSPAAARAIDKIIDFVHKQMS